MDRINQIEQSIDHAKARVDKAKSVLALFDNANFQEIVVKGYFEKEAIRMVARYGDGTASPEELQEQVFEAHISLAEQTGKPLIIHCVRRFQEVQRLCKDRKIHKVIHGFNKNEILAEEILRHGFYLSFGFAALHSLSLQKIISEMPIDRIFLETDSRDFQISELYEKVAALKNIFPENLEKQISENLKNIQHGR